MTADQVVNVLKNEIYHLEKQLTSKEWLPNDSDEMLFICKQIEYKRRAIDEIQAIQIVNLMK